QHEVCQVVVLGRLRPDTDPEPGIVLAAQRGLDAAKAVVSAGAAGSAQPESSQWQRNLVDQHKQVAGRIERRRAERGNRPTAQVHVAGRLDQSYRDPGQGPGTGYRINTTPPRGEAPPGGEMVEQDPASVVAGALVLGSRVPEADDRLGHLLAGVGLRLFGPAPLYYLPLPPAAGGGRAVLDAAGKHADHGHVGVVHQLGVGDLDLVDVDRLADLQRSHVDLDVLRDVGREAAHGEAVQVMVEHAALVADAVGVAH